MSLQVAIIRVNDATGEPDKVISEVDFRVAMEDRIIARSWRFGRAKQIRRFRDDYEAIIKEVKVSAVRFV